MGNHSSSPAPRRTTRNDEPIKRALLVGCNYPKTRAELSGCVNDVEAWSELLIDCFGFSKENITILADDGDKGHGRPTGKNIKDHLTEIVHDSRPGDIVFFEFSGHGVQVPADEGGDYEEDGLDEALCPTDLNLIVDDDLRAILSTLDPGVKFTMVSDCCHSGGMLDHEEIIIEGGKEQVHKHRGHKHRGISPEDMKDVLESMKGSTEPKNRSIDVHTMEEMLKETFVRTTPNPKELKCCKSVRHDLREIYGDDASHAALATKTRDIELEKVSSNHYVGPGKKPEGFQTDPNKGILITGCQSMETSADVTDMRGRSFGALSHLVVQVLRRHSKKGGNRPITNRELVLKVREMLNQAGFAQNPCLECSTENADVNFVVW